MATELRLALAMRGGVSLAVWIGGAVQEVDHLRRAVASGAPPPPASIEVASGRAPGTTTNALATLALGLGHRSVVVDVLTGASAGGLNAVLYATSMASGRPLGELRGTWLEVADLERLLRRPDGGSPLSLLDSSTFHREIRNAIERMARRPEVADGELAGPPAEHLEVALSVTSVVPNDRAKRTDPAVPVSDERIDGAIRLRHDPRPGLRSSQSDFIDDRTASDEEEDAAISPTAGPVPTGRRRRRRRADDPPQARSSARSRSARWPIGIRRRRSMISRSPPGRPRPSRSPSPRCGSARADRQARGASPTPRPHPALRRWRRRQHAGGEGRARHRRRPC
ncbi:MAG: patatin-like phospholipase family protein [Acidimicrobiales bacterium]